MTLTFMILFCLQIKLNLLIFLSIQNWTSFQKNILDLLSFIPLSKALGKIMTYQDQMMI